MTEVSPPRWAATSLRLQAENDSHSEGLSAHRIVQAAIEIADEHGLARLSLRKLGENLGAGTMAAYRHIKSKDELVLLMVDYALGSPPPAIIQTPNWQSGLRLWAEAMASRFQIHQWLIDAPMSAIPMTPNRILWLEYVLQALSETSLGLQHLLDIALLVDGHVRNVARNSYQLAQLVANDEPQQSPSWLIDMLDQETYPMVRQVLAAGSLEDNTEQDLEFGLKRIISGIAALAKTDPA